MGKRFIFSKVLMFIVLITIIVAPPINQRKVSAETTDFYDISSSYWASTEINYLSSLSIIGGYEDLKVIFCP